MPLLGGKGVVIMAKRVFLIVLDSFGIGGAPDAAAFGDIIVLDKSEIKELQTI